MARRQSEGVAITQRSDGRFMARVSWTDDAGRSKRTAVYGRSAKEVKEKLKSLRARIDDGLPARDSKVALSVYVEAWVAGALAVSDRKATTKQLYAQLARTHVARSEMGRMPLDRLKPSHIETWVATLRTEGRASSTVRQDYTILRAILDTAVRDELLGRNPAAAITRPKVEAAEAAYLTPAQVRVLLAAAESSRYAAVFTLLVNTGLRRGEALALRWSDVDLDAQVLRVRGTLARADGRLEVTSNKTEKSRRTVPLSATAVLVLEQVRSRQRRDRLRAGSQWAGTPFVFTTELGEPCDPRNALRALKAAAARAGLPSIGPHTLRHSAASVMLTNGVPLKVVSDVLGHLGIAITADVYGHVSPDVSREALAALSNALDT